MKRSRIARCLACFILLFAALTTLLGSPIVLAAEESSSGPILSPPSQEEPQSEGEPIEFFSKFPTIEGVAGDTFDFEIMVTPSTDEYAVKYDFNVTAPPGWEAGVWGDYPKKRVSSIDFSGERVHSETIEVKAVSLPGENPEPGDYVITLEMTSAEPEFKASIDLTAVVTYSYEFGMYTETGRLSAQVTAGEDNHITILLINTGTGTIEDLTLSSDKPEGWDITFNPEKIDTLEPFLRREVDVVIKPPKKAIAGDYVATLTSDSERGSDSLEMRITVLTSTIWGWAGIGIAAGVIAGLVVLFRRLGRR
ncbi:MAG: NEW3 domain-containing protein [Dehalococcoidales bacterium]